MHRGLAKKLLILFVSHSQKGFRYHDRRGFMERSDDNFLVRVSDQSARLSVGETGKRSKRITTGLVTLVVDY